MKNKLEYNNIYKSKRAFIFELDNVLYPEKDYLLQIYYLFANLLEYTELHPPANELIAFFKKAYEHHGPAQIFERAAEAFGIDQKHLAAFNRLHVDAKLPLKLVLFESVKEFLQAVLADDKVIFILTRGNPLVQLNKLKQVEWNGLDKILKVYFYDELIVKGVRNPLDFLLNENALAPNEVLVIGNKDQNPYIELIPNIDYMAYDI